MSREHHIKKNINAIGQHLSRHHKKYITWWIAYTLTHFLVIHAFFIKILFIKIIIAVFAIFGVYHQYHTFAEVQTICINNKNLVPFSKCEINFSTIKEAIVYVEKKMNMADTTIYDNIEYHILQDILNNYCPSKDIKIAETKIKETIKKITASSPTKEYEKLTTINNLFDRYKANTLQYGFSGNYTICTQKYIDYTILNKLKSDFINILDKKHLLDDIPKTIFDLQENKDDEILLPTIQHTLANITWEKQITISNNYPSYKTNDYSNKLIKKITELTEILVNKTIETLIEKWKLTKSDLDNLDKKISIKYILGCGKIRWNYTIQQIINDKNETIKNIFQNITINANICFNYQYIQNLEKYIQQITAHELGHYIYYFKDANANKFIGNYVELWPEEDYAESFAHQYLWEN